LILLTVLSSGNEDPRECIAGRVRLKSIKGVNLDERFNELLGARWSGKTVAFEGGKGRARRKKEKGTLRVGGADNKTNLKKNN